MIGYLIEQELGNLLPAERPPRDAADDDRGRRRRPRVRESDEADRPASTSRTRPTGSRPRRAGRSSPTATSFRRVVPSPLPQRIFEIRPIRSLLEQGAVVICAGGGGIPTRYTDEPAPAGRRLVGVEAVIDKDLASALLAIDLDADVLADRHRRRRRLRRLGHARAAADPPRRPGDPEQPGIRRGLDGAEGARGVRVRRADGQAGR